VGGFVVEDASVAAVVATQAVRFDSVEGVLPDFRFAYELALSSSIFSPS